MDRVIIMNKAIVNLIILDSSGSMCSIKEPIMESFNSQIQSIKDSSKQHDIQSFAGLIVFSSGGWFGDEGAEKRKPEENGVKTIFLCEKPEALQPLNGETYQTGGGTALYDAIGYGIKALSQKLGYYFQSCKVLVTIFTDGEENSSRCYNGGQIADLIKEHQDEHDWTFVYIGANHDVAKFARDHNILATNALQYAASGKGVQEMTRKLETSTIGYYASTAAGDDTKADFFEKS